MTMIATCTNNKNADRFLLQVNVNDNVRFDKTFNTYNAMKDYIKQRQFYFVHCDYSTYDLAIKLKR